MIRTHYKTLCWLVVSIGSFALGWCLKPEAGPERTSTPGMGGVSLGAAESLPAANAAAKSASDAVAKHSEGAVLSPEASELERRFPAGPPLTSADIDELGRQFKQELDPTQRRLIFARLMAGLTLENALDLRKQIAGMDPNSPEFLEFHYAWGKIAGAEAVLHGKETPEPDMAATMAGWASADPAAALAWFASLEKQSDTNHANQDHLKMALVRGLANTDPAEAMRFIQGMAASGDKQTDQMMNILTGKMLQSKGAVESATWAASLPAGTLRSAALAQVARDYARSDPQGAASWAGQYGNEAGGGRILGEVSNEWARRDGPAAVGWLQSLSDGPAKSGAYFQAFDGWAAKDPMSASKYLVTMPPSASRDQAIGGLVNRYRWEDPVSAVAWAGDIQDTATRENSMVTAGQAYYKRDPAGATNWLASSGLSAGAQARVVHQ